MDLTFSRSDRALRFRPLLFVMGISVAIGFCGPTSGDEIGPLRRNAQGEIVPVAPAQIGAQAGDPSDKLLGTPHRDARGNIVVVPTPQVASPTATTVTTARPVAAPRPAAAANAAPSRPSPSLVNASPPASGPSPTASATAPPLKCAVGAITCVEIDDTGARRQQHVPVTFGQPFAPGDLPAGSGLIAKDSDGAVLPLQMDQTSSHINGSIRHAVLSTVIPDLPAKGHVIVNLFKAGAREFAPSADPGPLLATGYDMTVDATVHVPQITQITFGDRNGQAGGTPFLEGETITIALGDRPEDRHTLTVNKELAGGAWPTLTKIAETFTKIINESSGHYRAYRIGEVYEDLWVMPREMPGTAFTVKFIYTGRAKLITLPAQEFKPTRHYVTRARPLLERAKNTWLQGPIVTEFTLMSPFLEEGSGTPHPQLTARFDVRFFPDARRVRSDVTIENDWAYEPSPGNAYYDIAVRAGGETVFLQKNLTHYHHGRWHKTFWSGETPATHVRYSPPYLFRSRMVLSYDTSLSIAERAISDDFERLGKSDTKPMGTAGITQYFPMTGGRDDIGPLPRWSAQYLLSQDPREKAVMLANADAAGGIPIHLRDRPTDEPVSLDDHPGMAMMFGRPSVKDAFPVTSLAQTPWVPDSAHQPSLAYLPYVVTGDRYYLDELMFWANWDMGNVDPSYREQGLGLIYSNQVRAQAWALRALAEAAHAVPDRHPMKAYFVQKLRNNLQWYVDTYIRKAPQKGTSIYGWVGDNVKVGPWQNDFLFIAVGQIAVNGDPVAMELARWMSNFTVGRWSHEADGYCHTMGPAYYITMVDKGGNLLKTWADLFRQNWPDVKSCPTKWLEASYVPVARSSLAVAASLGIDGAARAFRDLTNEAPNMFAPASEDPTWAIVPGPPKGDARAER